MITSPIMHVHELTVDAALDSLRSSAQGLTSQEATRRLVEFGPNRIEQAARVPIALRFVREFAHFFAVVLWLAALLAFAADLSDPGHGMRALALAIVVVILVNGLFSFWQEYRAEEAFRALQQLLPQEVTTLRDGRASRIPATFLPPLLALAPSLPCKSSTCICAGAHRNRCSRQPVDGTP